MKVYISFVFTALLSWLMPMTLQAQSLKLTSDPAVATFTLVDSKDTTCIVVDEADADVVHTAAECLVADIKAVSGADIAISAKVLSGSIPILAGTLGRSPLIDRLITEKSLGGIGIRGKWESFGMQIVKQPMSGVERALVVYGSTPRGTAYGLLELSRMMGVSPWIWWADVAPRHRSELYLSGWKMESREPSVRYRGIFLNDEDWGLEPWAATKLDKPYKNIGPNTYARIMELLLRLRANTLWPAMHPCSRAFWDLKENLPVARKYDIMLGSSHCEQMLRDNEWEWRRTPWNGTNEDWDYPSNKSKIQRYWAERVGESRGYSAMYTLGMRGVHDWGISGYPTTADKVRGLTEIIGYQRQLLRDSIGEPTTIPQLFIPYKEVLDAYNAGLQVPEDVTLCWVDDNHGYIRQMPKAQEQARSGGNGIYYHISYWGTPADYLWLCSTSPSLISYELSKAYACGIRSLWVINVGDIKPAEEELEFCMDLAWDIDAWTPEKAVNYTRDWAARTFGEVFADEIAAIKLEYYRLAAAGKPEHVVLVDYSNTERNRRIEEYRAIADRVDALSAKIPQEMQDAFFELIEYPVKAAYQMNIQQFRAPQSMELAAAGQREAALDYALQARTAATQIARMTVRYNRQIANGKWNGMMTANPRSLEHNKLQRNATASDVADVETELPAEVVPTSIAAADYSGHRGSIVTFEGLGVGGRSVGVWPLDMKAYSIQDLSQIPYVEYEVPVRAGENELKVRCLPTFPIDSSYDLRLAVSMDGATPEVFSLKTVATQGKWNSTVLQGYNDATTTIQSTSDDNVNIRIYLLDPGLVISDLLVRQGQNDDMELTSQLIENYDFEKGADGKVNPAGSISRGVPCGWKTKGELTGNSFGINQDAQNIHETNVCWMNSTPMPADFRLYQTIPHTKLQPGRYRVSCRLAVVTGKLGTCRLYANKNVQYYGRVTDYTGLTDASEASTYANYNGCQDGQFLLREMSVVVDVAEGEDLEIGVRTGNQKKDGSVAKDNTGWFKVDYFRITCLETDQVTSVKKEVDDRSQWYTLSGHSLGSNHPQYQGLYIHEGQLWSVRTTPSPIRTW